jgi:group I intron endonuclease
VFGKTHSEETKLIMRRKKVKYPSGVGIYELSNNLVKSFYYPSDLASYLNVSKVTVSKYINKGLVFKDKYYLRINPFKE